MGYQCLGDTSTSTWRQASSSLAKHLARSVPPTTAGAPGSGAGHGPAGAAGADGADFFAVATLWFPAKWRAHKGALLLAVVAQGLRAAHVAADAGGEGGAGVEEASMLAACRSGITLFALLARLHAILNKGSSSVAESAGAGVGGDGSNDSSSSSVEASRWAMEAEVAQEMIRGEHLALMESCDELVEFTQEVGASLCLSRGWRRVVGLHACGSFVCVCDSHGNFCALAEETLPSPHSPARRQHRYAHARTHARTHARVHTHRSWRFQSRWQSCSTRASSCRTCCHRLAMSMRSFKLPSLLPRRNRRHR
jgi:hypothetical protein